jgi:hypothetical protein
MIGYYSNPVDGGPATIDVFHLQLPAVMDDFHLLTPPLVGAGGVAIRVDCQYLAAQTAELVSLKPQRLATSDAS